MHTNWRFSWWAMRGVGACRWYQCSVTIVWTNSTTDMLHGIAKELQSFNSLLAVSTLILCCEQWVARVLVTECSPVHVTVPQRMCQKHIDYRVTKSPWSYLIIGWYSLQPTSKGETVYKIMYCLTFLYIWMCDVSHISYKNVKY